MPRTPTVLVLRAYKKRNIDVRLDFILEAFWDDLADADDIVARIKEVCATLRTMEVIHMVPIIHCQRLLLLVEDYLDHEATVEMSYAWFVSAVLRATNWLHGADCDAYADKYLRELDEEVSKVTPVVPMLSQNLTSRDDDFGFTIVSKTKEDSEPFPILLYAIAAIKGMLALYDERSRASELANNSISVKKQIARNSKHEESE